MHLFGRPLDWEGLEAAARGGAARGRRRRARRALPRPPCGVARAARLSLVPSAQDRHDRRGRRSDDRRPDVADSVRRLRHHGIVADAATSTSAAGRQLPARRRPRAPSACRSWSGSTSCSPRASSSPRRTAERLAGVVETPVGGRGRPARLQAYVVRVDRRDEVLARCARPGSRADRHLRPAPPRRRIATRARSRAQTRVRARAGAAVPHALTERARPVASWLSRPARGRFARALARASGMLAPFGLHSVASGPWRPLRLRQALGGRRFRRRDRLRGPRSWP